MGTTGDRKGVSTYSLLARSASGRGACRLTCVAFVGVAGVVVVMRAAGGGGGL